MKEERCAGCRKAACDGCGLAGTKEINTIKKKQISFPRDFFPEEGEGLGIAFDVGSTTLAGTLWDLHSRRQLAAETELNPQTAYGADIISRLAFCQKGKEYKDKLQRLLAEALDRMARHMYLRRKEEASGQEITRVTAVGNTAMCEILAGCSLKGMLEAPFFPDYKGSIRVKGETLGFSFLGKADVIILPAIGGYVGSDALAVFTCVKAEASGGNILAVDIGTNGELLLLGKERSYAASAAAGPALEGAAAACGMRDT